jgi:hypothetical protein
MFTYQQMHCVLNLEMFKIYTIIHKYRSYMFRSSTIIRELVLSLAKVMLEHYVLIGYVVVWQHVCNRKVFFGIYMNKYRE